MDTPITQRQLDSFQSIFRYKVSNWELSNYLIIYINDTERKKDRIDADAHSGHELLIRCYI
jgi:hypothetical protein